MCVNCCRLFVSFELHAVSLHDVSSTGHFQCLVICRFHETTTSSATTAAAVADADNTGADNAYEQLSTTIARVKSLIVQFSDQLTDKEKLRMCRHVTAAMDALLNPRR